MSTDPQTVLAVRGIENTTPAFQRGVIAMANRLEANPDYLLAVMSFETGGTFDPGIRNPYSGAVGLIQFTKKTASILGTTDDELGEMGPVEQLLWVEEYFKRVGRKVDTLTDHYMAVFAPIGIGKPPGFALYADDRRYEQNRALDANEDGTITVAEASAPVQRIVDSASGRLEVPPDSDPFGGGTDGAAKTGSSGVLALLLFILGIRRFMKHARHV